MDLTEVRAVAADSRLAAVFNTAEGTPLLHMDEVGYNFWGEPILMSKEYYMDCLLYTSQPSPSGDLRRRGAGRNGGNDPGSPGGAAGPDYDAPNGVLRGSEAGF